jgi:hypothetical protein
VYREVKDWRRGKGMEDKKRSLAEKEKETSRKTKLWAGTWGMEKVEYGRSPHKRE